MPFKAPNTVLFFRLSPTKLIVACRDDIFVLDGGKPSMQSFSNASHGAFYRPHALALSDDDAVLVAGNACIPNTVCGYDTASLTRLWKHTTVDGVGAVYMLDAHALVTVFCNPTLVLDLKTGEQIATLQKADGFIYGLGAIESLCFIPS
jgi:hypothetical protein